MLHRRSASQQVDPSPERQRRKIVGVGWRDSLLPLGKEELEVVSSADVPTQAAVRDATLQCSAMATSPAK
jgi:hypothetical protein